MEAAVTSSGNVDKSISYLDIPALITTILALEQSEADTRFASAVEETKKKVHSYPSGMRAIIKIAVGPTA